MSMTVKNTFGNRDSFQIVCEVDMSDKKYLFSKMQFYIGGKKICNENKQIFVLNDALVRIKNFLLKYEKGAYSSVFVSKHITENLATSTMNDIFSKLFINQQNHLLECIENEVDNANLLYDALDNIYLDFEWEPLVGYMFHFIKHDEYEWLFWDNIKMDEYIVQKFEIGEFYLVIEAFYNWANRLRESVEQLKI